MASSLSVLQDKIGYHFKDEKLLVTALTHSSAGNKDNYERLEFLGDRVLGLVMADILYNRFPHENEGDMAKRLSSLVQGSTVASLSDNISLGEFVILSDAEKGSGGRRNDNILADVYEALIGAVYLDGGLEPCRLLIASQWADIMDKMIKPPLHPKTQLQEWAQARGLSLPVYRVLGQSGPDHAPVFEVELEISGYDPVQTKGRTRQDAEKKAAKAFLKTINA